MSSLRFAIPIGVLAVVFGCAKAPGPAEGRYAQAPREAPVAAPQAASVQPAKEETAILDPVAPQRKIIYEATVDITTNEFDRAVETIPKLVREHGGYLSEISVDQHTGRQRIGRWTARVPAEKLDSFLDAVCQLGVPETRRLSAHDVTDQFIDLEARIANKKRLEERLLKLLERAQADLKQIIQLEQEVARVRTEIEQMEGRLRFLKNRVALSTVRITLRERLEYVPPQSPTFLERIRTTWRQSAGAAMQFIQGVILFLVAITPWLPVMVAALLLGMLILLLVRKIYRWWRPAEDQ